MKKIKIAKIELCSRKICSIEKDGNEFILKDCNDKGIWKSNKGDDIINALKDMNDKYCALHDDAELKKSKVWILKTKGIDGKWNYKNVASCCRLDRLNADINNHVMQLTVKEAEKKKDREYQALWKNGAVKIEFREVDIERYIKAINELDWFTEDLFIRSLVFADYVPQADPAKAIYWSQRAEYVEGRIAFEYDMKVNGIWHPSGNGIDRHIYDYYSERKK